MEFIIKDKELAQLLSAIYNNKDMDSVYVRIVDGDTHMIMPMKYENYIRLNIIINDIPKEVLDRVKVLLTLDVKRHDAFQLLLPYLKKDK